MPWKAKSKAVFGRPPLLKYNVALSALITKAQEGTLMGSPFGPPGRRWWPATLAGCCSLLPVCFAETALRPLSTAARFL